MRLYEGGFAHGRIWGKWFVLFVPSTWRIRCNEEHDIWHLAFGPFRIWGPAYFSVETLEDGSHKVTMCEKPHELA